jgi:hypothetical protein
MNKDIKESAYTNHGASKEIFSHYYKESYANNSLQENYWNTENADDGIITMEEFKALKKTEKHQANITRILNFINTQEAHLMRDDCFFNNIYIMREMPGECNKALSCL